ncbi:uncharacterized protein PHACADRAFT_254974 [Phanerochaete carnosa HHB-10118-sp]|uniref:Cytochrome P450 n=1 Tax=Phanerochaete carnosa (strain HHB-10118-sp) TaxID=650164 RepID=K5WE27_PHACS|nr:uncharacterized protein PHACADRAFT_254974 [Phanerochaete carnosa HHB-10118-sp]EKM57284.1 hypothetical protein PHACADRAFT_254974 [Phanerochaete carnosa HHB-10118-sp]
MPDTTDPKLLVCSASFACYLVYKYFEPNNLSAHVVLLLGVPALLVGRLSPQLSFLQQAGAVIFYWSLILVFTATYRLSPFHPLAKYPGPTLGKLSRIYVAYFNGRGDLHRVIRDWHDRYGDVVRIGPNELSFCRADALQPIYVAKSMQKGPYYDTRTGLENITTLDGVRDFSVHGARRKPWVKAMGISALKGYEPILQTKILELVEVLSKRQKETIDISHWMNLFGFDLIGHVAFGHEFGMLKAGEDDDGLMRRVEDGVYATAVLSQTPWILPFIRRLPPAVKAIRDMRHMGATLAQGRTKNGSASKDLFYFLTEDETAAESGATLDEIIADGILALVAGSDTTATVLSHLCYFMLRHPECAERLHKEIDATFPPGEDPLDFSRHADMPYLNACINETLRLLPAVLGGLQRIVKRGSSGATIGPHVVPEGTQVSVHTFSLHRDPREFAPLPDVFWPDRWLAQDTYVLPSGAAVDKAHVTTNRAAFVPFSVGPQNCAGRALAMIEMRAVVCAVMHKFELRRAEEYDLDRWERDVMDAYISLRGKLPVILEQRQGR